MNSGSGVRLQKVLAQAGLTSRRGAERLIESGVVSVNGEVVTKLGTVVDPSTDVVTCRGRRVQFQSQRYYLFYKPRGVITTLRDTHGRETIERFLKLLPVRVFPVGRLDRDVSGVLLLTNDGLWAEHLLHPRYGVERVYRARVAGDFSTKQCAALQRGVMLDGEKVTAYSVRSIGETSETVEQLGKLRRGESLVELTVKAGRKHFVKRLFKAVERPVIRLIRTRFGDYRLAGLEPGGIVELFPEIENREDRIENREDKSGSREDKR